MSVQARGDWFQFQADVGELRKRLDRVQTAHVNSTALRQFASQIAQNYFSVIHPLLTAAGIDEDQINTLTTTFRKLMHTASRRSFKAKYQLELAPVRSLIPTVSAELALREGRSPFVEPLSVEDKKILATLDRMVPSAGSSYRQAIFDLNDPKRISFRGPAMELREVLREILDHLAPDKSVMGSDGFVLEKGRSGPTMKQKVRFILRARDESKTVAAAPEDAAVTIDGMIGDLARSVYNRSSLVGHVATEQKNVLRLKRFVDVVLQEILEL